MIGTTLGHYRILEKLGAGGPGEVYAAEDAKLGRRVALRLLPPDMVADPLRLARFEREARAVAALNHPNIVSIYSVEEAEGVQFLTLELVEGKTLGELIPPRGLPLEDLLRLALPLADAVAFGHEHGIVHGSLRPASIMVAADGRLKVLDFGLAALKMPAGSAGLPASVPSGSSAKTARSRRRTLGQRPGAGGEVGPAGAGSAPGAMTSTGSASDAMTGTGRAPDAITMAGGGGGASSLADDTTCLATSLSDQPAANATASSLSPEQADGRPLDHRSDIFSLGVVLYEMACGQRPFSGDTAPSVIASILKDTPPPVSALNRAVPAALERVIARALAKNPAERYQSARVLVDDLRQVQERAAPRRIVSSLVRGVVRSRRVRRLTVAAVLVAVAATAVLYLVPSRPRSGRLAPSPAPRATFTQLTAAPGIEQFPSFTPDGKWVVYAGQQSGNWDVYIQGVGEQAAANLTADSPADDNEPALSPDGERIAFRSTREGGGIYVMGRDGKGVTRVTPAGVSHAYNPAWSPDETEIAYTTEDVQLTPLNWERTSHLFAVRVSTGEQRQLQVADAVRASWSPHGHRIAYASRPRAPGTGAPDGARVMDIRTIPARGGESVAVTSEERDWSPAWSRDGRFLYFVSDRAGSMNLWRVAIDEISGKTLGPPQPITTPAQFLAHPSVSADGRMIAYSAKMETGNIGRIALDPVTATVQGEMAWVTNGSQAWSNPDPSPDGQWIVAYTREQPEGDLYIIQADGSGRKRQLTSEPQFVDRVPRWSPDQTWISFFSTRETGTAVYKIRFDASGVQQMAPKGGVTVWSPNGRRLAASPRVAGTKVEERTTYLIDPNRPWDAQTLEVLPKPDPALRLFIAQDWSQDGTRLAGQLGYSAGVPGGGIVVYTFATRTYDRVSEFGEWPVWLPDNRRLLFVTGSKEYWVVDTRTKQKQKVYSVPRGSLGPARLTRDGRFAFFPLALREADIYVLRFEAER